MSRPQRVLSFEDGKAIVEFEGEKKTVTSPFPLKEDDYVLCQQGFVVKRIPESDARGMLKEWKEMNKWI